MLLLFNRIEGEKKQSFSVRRKRLPEICITAQKQTEAETATATVLALATDKETITTARRKEKKVNDVNAGRPVKMRIPLTPF